MLEAALDFASYWPDDDIFARAAPPPVSSHFATSRARQHLYALLSLPRAAFLPAR